MHRRSSTAGVALALLAVVGCDRPAPSFVERIDGIELTFVERYIGTDWRHVFWNPDGTIDEIDFLDAPVADEDLVEVARHPRLRILKLGNTAISDAGLAHLRGLAELQVLGLRGTEVTGAGLAHVAALPALRTLLLAATAVDDEGLRHLRGHPALAELGLNDTRVTDAGLAALQELPALTAVHLRNCAVTEAGLERLRQARPGITIHTYEAPEGEAQAAAPGRRMVVLGED